MSEEKLWIVTDAEISVTEEEALSDWGSELSTPRGRKGLFEKKTVSIPVRKDFGIQQLGQEMGKFLQGIDELFQQAEQQVKNGSGMRLDEIEVCVEINGEGQVSLLGSGGKMGAKGGITLRFKRNDTRLDGE
jgi:hypothetical protein